MAMVGTSPHRTSKSHGKNYGALCVLMMAAGDS